MKASLFALVALCACGATGMPAPVPQRRAFEAGRVVSTPAASASLATKIDALFAKHARPDVPGCAVGVYRAGEIVFARGYGAASLENGVGIDRDTLFNVGSIAKQFTAAALLLLAQDGKVSLDDDVRKYIPELPDFGHPVRLRHLLHHTSGLRDVYALLPLEGFLPPDLADDDDALYALAHQKAPLAAPGTEWRYSNTGYFLAAIVAKRVTGAPFAEIAKTRIFEPLGMKSTVVLGDHRRVLPRRATGYAPRASGGFGAEVTASEVTGASLLYTSIADLARWDANFYTLAVGGVRMLEAMRTPGKLDDGKPLEIAYGMGLDETPRGAFAQEEHTGEDMGFVADIVRYPSERLTVACLCNDVTADATGFAHAVAEAVEPKLAGAGTTRHDAAASAPAPAEAPLQPLPPSALSEYVGRFTCDELRRDMRVSPVDGGLELGSWGRARGSTRLAAAGRDVFAGPADGLPSAVKLDYERDKAGRVRGFKLTTDGMTFRFTRRQE